MKPLTTLLLLIILVGSKSMAQSNPDELVDLFFKEFSKDGNRPNSSIRKIRNNFFWARSLDFNLYATNDIFVPNDNIGNYNEAQLINKFKLTEKFFIYSYAVIYGEHPLRFKLYIFNANSQWKIGRIKIDEDFDEDAYGLARIRN